MSEYEDDESYLEAKEEHRLESDAEQVALAERKEPEKLVELRASFTESQLLDIVAERAMERLFGRYGNGSLEHDAAFEARESIGEGEQAGIDVGTIEPVTAGSLMLSGDAVIAAIQHEMGDDVHDDIAEHFANASDEVVSELTAMLAATFDAWATKHGLQPTWTGIGKTVEVCWDVDADDEKNAANAVAAYQALAVKLP